jgi:carbon storage regulator
VLVLGRKIGERVQIGADIFVHVIEVRGEMFKLGFEAPIEVPIHREEVARRIAAEGPRGEAQP